MKNIKKLIFLLLSAAGLPIIPSSKAALIFYVPFDAAGGITLSNLGTPLGASSSWTDTTSATGNSGSGQEMTVRANGTTGATSGQT